MQVIKREDVLNQLESVKSGLSSKEIVEQSSCFVFHGGKVLTYNDEISCSMECDMKIEGAVQALPLLSLFSKLQEDTLKIDVKDNYLMVMGKKKRSGIVMEKDIILDVSAVDSIGEFKELHKEFTTAIRVVEGCASNDESVFYLTCIHITPKWVEACNNFQACRYPLDTGFKQPILVKRDFLKCIISEHMVEVNEAEAWVHFRNPLGLIISCRRYLDNYPKIGDLLKVTGEKINLPKGLNESLDKANIFSSDSTSQVNSVLVNIGNHKVTIKGEGVSGFYEETKSETVYKGRAISFRIDPALLGELSKNHNDAILSDDKMMIKGSGFRYITCLGKGE